MTTVTTTTVDYELQPIALDVAARLRSGPGLVRVADAHPGYPCRVCLRDAEVGEELLLVSYDPFDRDSPYRSAGPVFVHRHPCMPYAGDGPPVQLTSRQLSVRAYDAGALLVHADTIDGATLDGTLRRLVGDDRVRVVHVHNAAPGCFAVAVSRRRPAPPRPTAPVPPPS